MKPLTNTVALAAALLSVVSMTSSAAPFSVTQVVHAPSGVETVQYREYSGRGYYGRGYGYGGRGYFRRRGNGLRIGLGIAGAVIGGAIIADEIRRSGGPGSGYTRCSRAFRSFDPDTGTYTSYDGDTLQCPYL